jgi:peptide/nickel transport system substrate-binding protein
MPADRSQGSKRFFFEKKNQKTFFRFVLVVLGIAFALPALAQDLTITWADDSDSDVTYDPRVTQSRHEEQVIIQIFDQLLFADQDGKLYPGLAKSWTVSPDATSVTLQLRDDVTFQDGSKFDADAVRFTFDTIKDPATASQAAVDIIGPYASSDVIGPYTIKLNYSRPFPSVLDSLADDRVSIVSPAAVKKLGNAGFAQAPVGSGPFRFVSWAKSDRVVLERNPDYHWGPAFFTNQGPSKVARIVNRFIPNNATRVAALEAGEIQFSEFTPALDMKRLGESKNYKTLVGVAPGVPLSLMLNVSHGPLMDLKVRQAFMYAVDRPRIAQNLFFGLAKAAYGPLARTTPEYWKGVEDYYRFDRAKAAQLLDEAGWKLGSDGIREKDGQKLSIYYPALLEPDTGVAVQADLKRVGIDMRVENVTKSKQDEVILHNQYDVGGIRWVYNDPSVLAIPFDSDNIPAPGKFKFNWMHYSSPELDKVIADASAATTEADRSRLYTQAQKMIMDAAIFFAVHDQIQTIAYTSKLKGVHFARGQWQVRLADVEPAN